jgi:hypothetical protein
MSLNRLGLCHLLAALLVLSSALLIGGGSGPALAQDDAERVKSLHRNTSRPELASPYERVARFKLATRKKEYQVGETVGLAYALLNVSPSPAYFLKPRFPDFYVKAGAGAEQRVPIFLLVNFGIQLDSFELLEPGTFANGSTLLIAGCSRGNTASSNSGGKSTEVEADERAYFEQGSFGNIESGCIPFSKPGDYTITAEVGNDIVVEDAEHAGALTTVGKIRSEPLTIRIR